MYIFFRWFCFFLLFSIQNTNKSLFSFSKQIDISESFGALMSSVEKSANKCKDLIYLDDQNLEFVAGQRGKKQLLLNGYTFCTNLVVDNAIYWCCRQRTANQPACRARARTQQKPNGLHTVIISQPIHNHKPTLRTLHKKITLKYDNDLEWNDEFIGIENKLFLFE